ncbi:MAG: hypothetical protein V2I33_16635 [Kangiellaceae bacterium]|nr:hypothetical protein [Kangiellaceae bacterium]
MLQSSVEAALARLIPSRDGENAARFDLESPTDGSEPHEELLQLPAEEGEIIDDEDAFAELQAPDTLGPALKNSVKEFLERAVHGGLSFDSDVAPRLKNWPTQRAGSVHANCQPRNLGSVG